MAVSRWFANQTSTQNEFWTRGRKLRSTRRNILVLLATLAALATSMAHGNGAQEVMLNSGYLRFGNIGGDDAGVAYPYNETSTTLSSVQSNGVLSSPYYLGDDAGTPTWFQLTYSLYDLDFAVGVGSGGSDSAVSNTDVLDFYGDSAEPVVSSVDYVITAGIGTITYTGTFTVGSASLEIRHVYEVQDGESFMKATTTVKNVSGTDAENVAIWVGTRDDWIGLDDDNRKVRGNLGSEGFVSLTDAATQSKAVKVYNDNDGVLFYSTHPGANTIVNDCCSFSNLYTIAPEESFEAENCSEGDGIDCGGEKFDGSYGFRVVIGDLAPDETSEAIEWYYAAGAVADLDSVSDDVAQDSGAAPTNTLSLVDVSTAYQYIPFSVTVRLQDSEGGSIAATSAEEVTLTATGGEGSGVLRSLTSADAAPTATIEIGQSEVTFEGVYFTGVSTASSTLDVTLQATASGLTTATDTFTVRTATVTLSTSDEAVENDGSSTTTVTIRVEDSDGNPIPNVTIPVSTTLGTFFSGATSLGTTWNASTGQNGLAEATLRSSATQGFAEIATGCIEACEQTATVFFGPTSLATPLVVTPVSGDEQAWLVFDRAPGNGISYQYRLNGGAWITIPESATAPYLIENLVNGTTYTIEAQGVGTGGAGPISEAVTVTPNPVDAPDPGFAVESPEDRIEARISEGIATLQFDFILTNDGSETLVNAWLTPENLPTGSTITDMTPEIGTVTQFGERWFWQGVNLAPLSTDPNAKATLRLTVTIEVEE